MPHDNNISAETVMKNVVDGLTTKQGSVQTFYIILLNYGAAYVLLAQKLQDGTHASFFAFSYNMDQVMFFRKFPSGWV